MGAVTAQIVRRFVSATVGPESPERLLASAGISAAVESAEALRQSVDLDTYYGLLERAAGEEDGGLPFRYADSIRPEDFGAMGLAMKTASTLRDALERLARYVSVITDSLQYELREGDAGGAFVLLERPSDRRGARLANEGALAAVTSMLRQVAATPVAPSLVSFRHPQPATIAAHESFFACPVHFGAPDDSLRFDAPTLSARTRLADEGLSAYLLSQLDGLRSRGPDLSLAARVRRAVADSLCDGPPSRAKVARRLGMSERTLHRRLAEEGLSFRALADGARREAADSLLGDGDHTLAEVAFLPGFSEQSAFQRAFKRWSGRTPRAFRAARSGSPARD
jgi:AraC-like DNA-binding protein